MAEADEQSELQVLESDVRQKSSELTEECEEFADSKGGINFFQPLLGLTNICRSYRIKNVFSFAEIVQFQKIVEGLIEVKDEMAKEVETEKIKVKN